MSIPDNSHLKTIWEQHKQRIQNQKVVCTAHTLHKSATNNIVKELYGTE